MIQALTFYVDNTVAQGTLENPQECQQYLKHIGALSGVLQEAGLCINQLNLGTMVP